MALKPTPWTLHDKNPRSAIAMEIPSWRTTTAEILRQVVVDADCAGEQRGSAFNVDGPPSATPGGPTHRLNSATDH
jgi:hypothetical protein